MQPRPEPKLEPEPHDHTALWIAVTLVLLLAIGLSFKDQILPLITGTPSKDPTKPAGAHVESEFTDEFENPTRDDEA